MQSQTPQVESPLMSREQLTRYLQVSARTVDLLIARGVMRATRIGARVFVHRDEADRIVREGAELPATTTSGR